MSLYNTLVAWFFTFNILLFFLIGSWIIPGVNFVAGPVTLFVFAGINLIFFMVVVSQSMNRMRYMSPFPERFKNENKDNINFV